MMITTRAEDKKVNEYPGGDGRYEIIDQTMKRFNYQKDALLEALDVAQETFGYLPEDLLSYLSEKLNVPLSHVYGVATFFNMFTFEPVGEQRFLVCGDPACSVAGGEEVLQAVRQYAERDLAGRTLIERSTCLGLCDQAPAALVNLIAYVNLKVDEIAALFRGDAPRSRLQVTGEPRVMTRRIGELDPLDLDEHRSNGAFKAFEKALREMTPEEVIEQVKISGLSGRGGAGFPTGLKWQFTRDASDTPKYIVCNFDESEPGTFKDRTLMQGDPFHVLEGILIAGYAVGATQGYIFIRGEYPEATQVVQKAVEELYEAGLLGQDILGMGFNFDLTIRRSAGAYICGEETALFEAIEGNRGFPRAKPPFPTTHGLFGKPTSINNVETLALVPDIVLHGGEWLRQWGTEKSPGIKLFCLSGDVNQPGVVEAPYGLSVRQLIQQYGGGFRGEPQAILMGGAAGGLLHPDHFDIPLTNEDLSPLNVPIGSGVVMVFNQEVDLLKILKILARFFMHETCGQCVPCRVGTRQAYKLLDKISGGKGTAGDVDRLEHLAVTMRDIGLCGLGQTAPSPILSSFEHFRHIYPMPTRLGTE